LIPRGLGDFEIVFRASDQLQLRIRRGHDAGCEIRGGTGQEIRNAFRRGCLTEDRVKIRATQIEIDRHRAMALSCKAEGKRGGEQAFSDAAFSAADGPNLLPVILTSVRRVWVAHGSDFPII
jgi:hypothetical protein